MSETTAEFSWPVLLAMLATLGLSVGAFAGLARRYTTRSAQTATADWARREGFRRARGTALPAVLAAVFGDGSDEAGGSAEVERHYRSDDGRTHLLRLWAGRPTRRGWNVLLRVADDPAGPAVAGLRPVGRVGATSASAVDWFGLPAFARLAPGARFEVVGRDGAAARRLAEGPARALLPGDVGLVRGAGWVLLDFSGRAFEPVEMNRMIAVADQVGAGGAGGAGAGNRAADGGD